MLRELAVSKLRWTLLILGGAFIIALALWERWRPHQGRGSGVGPGGQRTSAPDVQSGKLSRDERAPNLPGVAFPGEARLQPAEPWIGDPGLTDVLSSESELPPEGELRAERPRRASPGIGAAPGQARQAAAPAASAAHEEPAAASAALDAPSDPVATDESLRVVLAQNSDESPTTELPVLAEAAVDVPASQALEETVALEGPRPEAPIVQWPPEESRQIVALRLVAPPERFPGRAVRLALAAEGFLLGKFDIFHKPDEAHRALVSAASLTRPGTFDLDTMDSQRYPGLSLFVVLPGPCPAPQAFDELVDIAKNLCERLQGELQDARGEALTDEIIERQRETLTSEVAGEAAS